MKCPACQADMKHSHPKGVEIDVCTGCRGVWLDATELDGLLGIEDDKSVEAGLEKIADSPEVCRYCGEKLEEAEICGECGHAGELACPRDGEPMYLVEAIGLELDRCPACRGLWVDGFERCKLSKMRRQLAEQAVAVESGGDVGDEAFVMGAMMAGGLAGEDNALAEAFGVAGEGGEEQGQQEKAVDSPTKADRVRRRREAERADKAAVESSGGKTTMREYIDKYGNLEIVCCECAVVLTRYTAWERDGDFLCMSCGSDIGSSLDRAMKYKGPPADYWHDEKHLVDALKWLVGGIIPWKK